MRWLLPSLSVAALAVLSACPRHHAGGTVTSGALPAGVRTYGALRWVPRDPTYVVTGKTAADVVALERDLVQVLGIMGNFDLPEVADASMNELAFDATSVDSLAALGIDPSAGVAVYSIGLSPTIAARLADPDKLTSFVDGLRDRGVAMQSQLADGQEVFTVRMEREVSVSWTVLDGWVLAHVSFAAEREPELAWLTAARGAAGGFAGSDDFTAALAAATAHTPAIVAADGPPVLGALHPGALIDAALAAADPRDANDMEACVGPLRTPRRVLLAAGSGTGGATGALVVDGIGGLAGMGLAAPAGWYDVRAGAPVQVDLGLDLRAVAAVVPRCRAVAELVQFGVRTAHAAALAFDDGLPSKAAAYADLSTDRFVRGRLSQIPMLSQFSSRKKVAGADVVEVSIPFTGIGFVYQLAADHALAAMGSGVAEALLGAGRAAPAGELLHLSLRPSDVPDDVWDLALDNLLDVSGERNRAVTIRRLRAWDQGDVDAVAAGDQLVVTASGVRHRAP